MRIIYSIPLCFLAGICAAQDPTEIYLFDVQEAAGGGLRIENMRNITQHEGYDNQPFFHPAEPVIYYSSFDEQGRSDIKSYNFKTQKTSQITETEEREYSPTVTPDGKFLSCIIQRDDGAQDLGKYPIAGGDPVILIDDLLVGYHAWIGSDRLLLFVLGEGVMNLHHVNLSSGENEVIADNIGRALHQIPGQEAMSFVDKSTEDDWWVMRFDIDDGSMSKLIRTLPGREDLAWTPDGRIVMSDGQRILVNSMDDDGWDPVEMGDVDLSGITRVAISPDGNFMAVVADE